MGKLGLGQIKSIPLPEKVPSLLQKANVCLFMGKMKLVNDLGIITVLSLFIKKSDTQFNRDNAKYCLELLSIKLLVISN